MCITKALLQFCSLVFAGHAILLTSASALTLGPLVVHSKEGQPLSAEIELLSLSLEESGRIEVKISSQSVHLAKGLGWSTFVSTIMTDVILNDPLRRPYIRLRSIDPPPASKFDLDLSVFTTTGRYNREYSAQVRQTSEQALGFEVMRLLSTR
jgi:Tfp pilus assembly protein FimV